MALIVEDGSNVPGANTYVDRDEAIAYAADRGVVLPDTQATDVMIIKAMDYLALYDAEWKGYKTYNDQALAWPRKEVRLTGAWVSLPDDLIPNQLCKAQLELVMQVANNVALLPTLSAADAFVTREKVDVIETQYSEAIAVMLLGALPTMPLVSSLITPLLSTVGRVRTVRI